MSFVLCQLKLKKRQIRQSVFTLLVFFASFFSHSEHFTQVEFEALTTFEQHDCHLCQQGIDSPPAPLELKPAKEHVFCIANTHHVSVILAPTHYIYPLLRAPPSFL